MTDQDPIRRFTNRADNYARYRPTYPAAAIDCLRVECGLTPTAVVADVGAGTGILTGLLLPHAGRVYAVEPNVAMRAEAERALGDMAGFVSVDGRAEATTLPDGSIDLITVAQAFHWFDLGPTQQEFRRILRPGRFVALLWNARDEAAGGFVVDYEALLDSFGNAYRQVRRQARVGDIDMLFPGGYQRRTFRHERRLDYETLHGGLLSGSYSPLPGDVQYEAMVDRLRTIFEVHQVDGLVTMPYETHVLFSALHG